jgi:hypothetical protein
MGRLPYLRTHPRRQTHVQAEQGRGFKAPSRHALAQRGADRGKCSRAPHTTHTHTGDTRRAQLGTWRPNLEVTADEAWSGFTTTTRPEMSKDMVGCPGKQKTTSVQTSPQP